MAAVTYENSMNNNKPLPDDQNALNAKHISINLVIDFIRESHRLIIIGNLIYINNLWYDYTYL